MRAALLAALALVPFTLLAGCGGDGAETVVPYVTGLKEQLATDIAEHEGLRVQIKHQPGEAARIGFVYAQSPREGSKVEQGADLTIWVSTNG